MDTTPIQVRYIFKRLAIGWEPMATHLGDTLNIEYNFDFGINFFRLKSVHKIQVRLYNTFYSNSIFFTNKLKRAVFKCLAFNKIKLKN